MPVAAQPAIEIFGTPACGDCVRNKRWLDERGYAYSWHDISTAPELAQFVIAANERLGSPRPMRIPVIMIEGHPGLSEPSNAELAAALGVAE